MSITELLQAPLLKDAVKTRSQAGMKLSYVDGHHVISEANRIFGHFGWAREVMDCRTVQEEVKKSDKGERWYVSYTMRVRVTTYIDGEFQEVTYREGCGFGQGIDRDLGQAHESAYKEAETDAMKRALMTYGNTFGLALYDKTHKEVSSLPAGEYKLPVPKLDTLEKAAKKAGVPMTTLFEVCKDRKASTAEQVGSILKELQEQAS